ncbi:MAG: hypothetical protein WCK89_03110 [bacterium]
MDPKTTIEKLQILLPHWIEHNNNHEAEFRKWAAAARTEGAESLAGLLDKAAASMAATDELLKKTLAEAGGPANDHHPHHH